MRKLATALVTRKVVPPMPMEANGMTTAAIRNVFMAPFTGPLFSCKREQQSQAAHVKHVRIAVVRAGQACSNDFNSPSLVKFGKEMCQE